MALLYGMSSNEFWEEDPDLFWAYRFSFYEKLKLENEVFNINAHLQGAYFMDALQIALSNCFGKGKKIDYPRVPYGMEEKVDLKEQKQKQIVNDLKKRVEEINKLNLSNKGNK